MPIQGFPYDCSGLGCPAKQNRGRVFMLFGLQKAKD